MNEFDTFQLMIESIKLAAHCARKIGHLRNDRRFDTMADLLDNVVENLYDLSTKKAN